MDTTRYGELRRLVRSNFSATTQQLVDDAVAFAAERLRDQTRYDGSPMLDHGIGVAHIVITEIGLGRNSTLAAILHDVVRIAAAGDAADLVDVTAEIVDANQRARFLAGPDSGNTVFAANGNRSAENNFRNQFQAFF